MTSAKWYVIRTEPRAEYLATDELTKDGYEIFFPRIAAACPRFGRNDEPLFPGYLFIRWENTGQGLPTFRPAHRVSGWINFDGSILSIPDSDVDTIQRRIDKIDHQGGVWQSYQVGERVRVVSRYLDCLAQVTEQPKSAKGRVSVLLDFMGRLVPTEAPWYNLRPIDDVPESMRSITGPNSPGGGSRARRTRGKGRRVQKFRSQLIGPGFR